MKNRTVTVELLRSGPPHNQLLSPLTPYLGVCGESGADVVHVPYEQYTFDRRLRELRYEVEGGSEEELLRRLELLRETGTEMASVLGGVPGLAAALKRQEGDGPLLHLRLVISASELALLPWELARVPQGAGIPAESWLLLQGLAPVTLTRHIRSVPTTAVRWPSRLRLLVVTGDPAEIPYQEHLEALGRAFAPWLPAGARLESDRPQGTVILENATVREIYAYEAVGPIKELDAAITKELGDHEPTSEEAHRVLAGPLKRLKSQVAALEKKFPAEQATTEAKAILAKYGLDK